MKCYGLNWYNLYFFSKLNSAICSNSSVFAVFCEKMKAIVKSNISEKVYFFRFFYSLFFGYGSLGQNRIDLKEITIRVEPYILL